MKIGQLYIVKSSVNLMFDILNVRAARILCFMFADFFDVVRSSYFWGVFFFILPGARLLLGLWYYFLFSSSSTTTFSNLNLCSFHFCLIFCHWCAYFADNLNAIYSKVRKLVDIDSRVEVLNKRLDVLEQLLEILRAEKTEQHAVRFQKIIYIKKSP